jgi:hypothetical protein
MPPAPILSRFVQKQSKKENHVWNVSRRMFRCAAKSAAQGVAGGTGSLVSVVTRWFVGSVSVSVVGRSAKRVGMFSQSHQSRGLCGFYLEISSLPENALCPKPPYVPIAVLR